MRTKRLIGGAFALSGFLMLSAPASSQDMEARDAEKIGEAIHDFLIADNVDDQDDAKAGVVKQFERVGKRLKLGDPMDVLARPNDLGRALFAANKYGKKGLKNGKPFEIKVGAREEITFVARLPQKYKPTDGPYPTVVIIPGTRSEDGKVWEADKFFTDSRTPWKDGDLLDQYIVVVLNMPEDTASWTEHQSADGGVGGVATVMYSLGEIRNRLAVDFNRIFLAGRREGVEAAVTIGGMFPHLFAGVVGRSGDSGEVGNWENFQNLPTMFASHGGGARAFEEKLKELGIENCSLMVDAKDPEVLEWMNANPRVSAPNEITLIPGSPIPNRAYWMSIPPTDSQGGERIHAAIDREANQITVDGTAGITSVRLFLNDDLVDLAQPIKVVLNGVAQESVVPRNLDDMLDLAFRGTSDPGCVYTAVKVFDLPAPQ